MLVKLPATAVNRPLPLSADASGKQGGGVTVREARTRGLPAFTLAHSARDAGDVTDNSAKRHRGHEVRREGDTGAEAAGTNNTLAFPLPVCVYSSTESSDALPLIALPEPSYRHTGRMTGTSAYTVRPLTVGRVTVAAAAGMALSVSVGDSVT